MGGATESVQYGLVLIRELELCSEVIEGFFLLLRKSWLRPIGRDLHAP
jgi:hypothetical protein